MGDGQSGDRRDPTNGQSLDAPTVRLAPVSGRARPWRRPLKITLIALGALVGHLAGRDDISRLDVRIDAGR